MNAPAIWHLKARLAKVRSDCERNESAIQTCSANVAELKEESVALEAAIKELGGDPAQDNVMRSFSDAPWKAKTNA